jgi:hypothetical protein
MINRRSLGMDKLSRQMAVYWTVRQAAVVVVRRGQTAALIISFPVFSPLNNMPSARGAFSNASTM